MTKHMNIEDLETIAKILRGRIIETSSRTSTPHLGSCLSCVDLLVALYFSVLKIDPKHPRDPRRDRFILSKGHAAPALFQILAMKGFYPESRLETYGQDGGVFAEHPPTPDHLEGIEAATGSLGHGLPMGLGMALSARINKQSYDVYAILSDGECNEGSVWEAAMLSAAQKVDNLHVIIDYNKWQATGRSQEVMALDPLVKKWEAFGWRAQEINGHDIKQIISALKEKPAEDKRPVAIIAHTIKGRGISFMEDDNNWHYRIPTRDEVRISKEELGLV